MITQMASAPGRDAEALLSRIEGLAQEPFHPGKSTPSMPTLFLAGDADPMTQGLDQIATLPPDARVLRVPGDHLGALHSDELCSAALELLGIRL